MGKYEPLWRYVKMQNSNCLKLSFEQIKEICGFEIDHSFLNSKKELLKYGYQVKKISMKEKWVHFESADSLINRIETT